MYRLLLLLLIPFFQTLQVTASSPIPSPVDFYLEREDGVTLRLAFLKSNDLTDHCTLNQEPRRVLIFIPGRTCCFENNYDLALRLAGYDLEDSTALHPEVPFDFWSLDNRGHGKSGGRLNDSNGIPDQRCHIDSFDIYVNDLHQALLEIKKNYAKIPANYFLMGLSMGGNILLNYLRHYEDNLALPFKRAIVIAPMVKFFTPGVPELGAFALANIATHFGFGDCFIPSHGNRDLSDTAFETYTGSHNKEDFLRQQAFFQRHPDMITEGATYGWIKAAYDAVAALEQMEKSPVPLSGFLAGQDFHVNTPAAFDFLTKLGAKLFLYESAYHVLTREPENYAPGFWEDLFGELT